MGSCCWCCSGGTFVVGNILVGLLMVAYAYLFTSVWFPWLLSERARKHAQQVQEGEGMAHEELKGSWRVTAVTDPEASGAGLPPGEEAVTRGGERLSTEGRTKVKARELMTAQPACCTPDDTVREAALMREHDCGCIPVVEDKESNRLVGVVTDRDIACRCTA